MMGEISILSWNVGFSRLGQPPISPSEFLQSALGLEREANIRRCREIANFLQQVDCDVYSLQEVCSASVLNSWVPVRSIIADSLSGYREFFLEDFRACFTRSICFARHGQSTLTKFTVHDHLSLALPQVRTFNPIYKYKLASANVVRLVASDPNLAFTVVNVHLAAVDDCAKTKRTQVCEIMKFAISEYLRGRYVIVCGDFNYCISSVLEATSVARDPHRPSVFPREFLPDSWGLVPCHCFLKPSAENLSGAEVSNSVVDGMIFSPNLALDQLGVVRHSPSLSDHPALRARLRVQKS